MPAEVKDKQINIKTAYNPLRNQHNSSYLLAQLIDEPLDEAAGLDSYPGGLGESSEECVDFSDALGVDGEGGGLAAGRVDCDEGDTALVQIDTDNEANSEGPLVVVSLLSIPVISVLGAKAVRRHHGGSLAASAGPYTVLR